MSPSITGPLNQATVAIKTESGKASALRAIDPEKTAVTMDDGTIVVVKTAVNDYVKNILLKKSAEDQAADAAAVLRAYVGAVRDENAYQGDYQKSYRVIGSKTDKTQRAADVSQVDKFSVPKTEDIKAIREALGDDVFKDVFEQVTTISIKKNILDNAKKRKELSEKLVEALGKEGIKEFFQKEDVYVIRKGMDQKQYALDPAVRTKLLEQVKQSADAVKDATTLVV